MKLTDLKDFYLAWIELHESHACGDDRWIYQIQMFEAW